MSDNEIRRILVEKKRKERQMQRRAEIIEAAQDVAAWGSLFMLCFMLSVIGG